MKHVEALVKGEVLEEVIKISNFHPHFTNPSLIHSISTLFYWNKLSQDWREYINYLDDHGRHAIVPYRLAKPDTCILTTSEFTLTHDS
jgi:hypothetical protein